MCSENGHQQHKICLIWGQKICKSTGIVPLILLQSCIILTNQPLLSRTSIEQWQAKAWWDEQKEATGKINIAIMCADNGHQGVTWSDRKRRADIKPIQIVQTFHCLTPGASDMDLVSPGCRKTTVFFVVSLHGLS